MANLEAGGMKSLGESYQIAGSSNARIVEAWTNTERSKIFASTNVQRVVNLDESKPDCTRPVDMNLCELQAANGKHLIDVMLEYQGQLDVNDIVAKVQRNKYNELPPPFCSKSEVEAGYVMNINKKQ